MTGRKSSAGNSRYAKQKSASKRQPLARLATFRAAVLAVPQIATAYRPGVQALKKEHRKQLRNADVATGSIELDEALRLAYPNDHRWDYGIGLPGDSRSERVLWVEVHHAASKQTEILIRKLEQLKSWLQAHAPELWKLPREFVWQLSNAERNPNDRRKRNALAEKYGIRRVQGALDLQADWLSPGKSQTSR